MRATHERAIVADGDWNLDVAASGEMIVQPQISADLT
jgi:hypothetical protein